MRTYLCLSLLSALALFVGCGPAPVAKPAAVEHAHDHPDHGPHEGELIELGDEEFHAELVHDEKTNDITIYILDSKAKSAVAIEATEVVINLKQAGQPAQHKLTAEPDAGDAAGKSSKFVTKANADLGGALEQEASEPRLQVTIQGKSYTGKIVHAHDHAH